MNFMMIVDDPSIAELICSVENVWPFVDLEYRGKAERQAHTGSWQSHQTLSDVSRIKEAVPEAHLLVRINPMNEGTAVELDEAIARGADSVMLPMFSDSETLERFFDLLRDRAAAVPLFETAEAVKSIPKIISRIPLTNIHIGLNDLHLDLGLTFMFECISNGFLEEAATALREAGIRFGIGGTARSGDGIVNPELILGEHVRLGSSATILSRSFHNSSTKAKELVMNMDFPGEISKLRQIYADFRNQSPEALEVNRLAARQKISEVVRLISARGGS